MNNQYKLTCTITLPTHVMLESDEAELISRFDSLPIGLNAEARIAVMVDRLTQDNYIKDSLETT